MPKYRIVPAAAAEGITTSLEAPGRAARARGNPGASIAPFCPATWDGQGAPPLGWTLPWVALPEFGGARVAIVATDAFAAGKSEFSGADDSLPLDWEAPS